MDRIGRLNLLMAIKRVHVSSPMVFQTSFAIYFVMDVFKSCIHNEKLDLSVKYACCTTLQNCLLCS